MRKCSLNYKKISTKLALIFFPPSIASGTHQKSSDICFSIFRFKFSDFNIAFDRCYALYTSGLFLSLILLKVTAQLDIVFTVNGLNKMIT